MADIKQWRILFHSSSVKFPLVNMSASWCLVSMSRIWILASKLILSNNKPRATLWVRETCLIVGVRPLVIILITASLSSKTYNIALEPEFVVFDGLCSMFVGMTLVCFIGMELCMFGLTTCRRVSPKLSLSLLGPSVLFGTEWILQSPNPREWEREYSPCVILHREKWFQLL